MRYRMRALWLLLLFAGACLAQNEEDFATKFTAQDLQSAPVALIPYPQQVVWSGEDIAIQGLRIQSAGAPAESVALALRDIVDFHRLAEDERAYPITLTRDTSLGKEAYRIAARQEGAHIEAATDIGYFYALQTIRQLLRRENGTVKLPLCRIADAPAYPVRGFMLDVGRNFQRIATLKKQLDIMARYKLNVFHWHLTDRPAWRIESKKYPQLNDPAHHRPTRDPGAFYTYAEIRELIDYARERHITVIPEIDMPGHSDAFVRAMGVKMESAPGMAFLRDILTEFFAEIPKSDCPIIHLGSDEVRIDNPTGFITTMVNLCQANDRQVVIWNPGLPADGSVIRQTWQSKHLERGDFLEIDSWNSYVNNGEPMTQIMRLFFKPIGYRSENEVIGGILCFWPDVNIDTEAAAYAQNPVYPSLVTYAWATWTADILRAPARYYTTLPPPDSKALAYFSAFEKYLIEHKEQYFRQLPFPYLAQADKVWKLIGPFNPGDGDALLQDVKDSYRYKGQDLHWQLAVGNTLVIKDRFRLGGLYPTARAGQHVYALTYLHAEEEREVATWIGFETPLRSNRTYTGIPLEGSWDANGGEVWLNDRALPAPAWKNPGWKPTKSEGWGSPTDQETPWREEELYWTRRPVAVPLKKGWNKLLVKIPSSSDYQNWMFTFAPLDMRGLRFSVAPTGPTPEE